MREPTFDAMCDVSPFELAQWWADRTRWPAEQDATSAVEELAVMSALGQWLRSWVPTTMHRALRDGATVEQVSEATGFNSAGVFVEWTQWALRQRALYEQTPAGHDAIGLSAEEYELVHDVIHGRGS